MSPRLRIVIIVVVVGDSRMKDFPCGQGLVSILLEVLRHCHNVWPVNTDFVIVVIALYGVRPPPSEKR